MPQEFQSPKPYVALVGTPNSGKSTLFNHLTGLRQKVGNFPGVTVEPKKGSVRLESGSSELVDLPGLYSLEAHSQDEEFGVAVLSGKSTHLQRPHACLFVIDGTNVEKSLTLFAQFAELQIPTIVVVTMIDSIKAQGGVLDDIGLERALGIPVLGVVGSKGIGVQNVRKKLGSLKDFAIPRIANIPNDASVVDRVEWARGLSQRVLNRHEQDLLTARLDSVLLHPLWGGLAFAAVMMLFFIGIFSGAEPLMQGIEKGIDALRALVETNIAPGLLRDALNKGVLNGVGSVLVFLPQIVILMLVVTLLEDCGYLARAAFIVDRAMGIFGLQGRSFIPLLGSFACAIPGIMSARIIPSHKDRMTTIMVAPLMTCSARLPVYALLIAAFVPAHNLIGLIPLQSAVMAMLYLVGLLSGLVVALVLRKTLFRSETLHFLIEFPPYRVPSFKTVTLTVWTRCQDFLKTAGTVILGISLALWLLSEFPRTEALTAMTDAQNEQLQLEHSYIGQLGRAVQPVFAPCGFDWKISIGVLGSFAARETFVSVMAQLFATTSEQGDSNLLLNLRSSMSPASAFSVLAFYIFALQCMSTVAIIRRESGSWKWAAIAFGYTFVLAYVASVLVFNITKVMSS